MTLSLYSEAMSSSPLTNGISGRGYSSSGYVLDGYLCGDCGLKRDGDWTLPCPRCSNTSICTKCGATGECRHSSPSSLSWTSGAVPVYRKGKVVKARRSLSFVTKPAPKFVAPPNRMTAKDRVKASQALKPNYDYLKKAFHTGSSVLQACLVCGDFDTVENGMCPVCVTAATDPVITELKVEQEDWLSGVDNFGTADLATGQEGWKDDEYQSGYESEQKTGCSKCTPAFKCWTCLMATVGVESKVGSYMSSKQPPVKKLKCRT